MAERQYSDTMLSSMQSAYGAGFLSPGAAEETHQMLEGILLGNKSVLDLGCGVGGARVLIARHYPVSEVVGADVEDAQIEQASALAKAMQLSNVHFRRIEPGALPFGDDTFDVVIAKDVVCHVEEKVTLFRELLRVLRPSGVFISADWHPGPQVSKHKTWDEYMGHLSAGGLVFFFEPASAYQAALQEARFARIDFIDHTAWSKNSAKEQLDLALGSNKEVTLAELGEAAYERRVAMTRARYEGLEDGSVEHWHIRGFKA